MIGEMRTVPCYVVGCLQLVLERLRKNRENGVFII